MGKTNIFILVTSLIKVKILWLETCIFTTWEVTQVCEIICSPYALVSYQSASIFLSTTSKLPAVNVERSYVKAFWAQNNEYNGLKGHTRNPPKMGGYTLNSTRKIKREVHRPSEIKRIRHRGYDHLMKTPSGRIWMMKKYLEKSPFLAECI